MYAFAPFPTNVAETTPLSFEFADSLPSQSWQAPSPAVLYDLAPLPESKPKLEVDDMETAWAETHRLGL